jgi:lipoprotein NlpD
MPICKTLGKIRLARLSAGHPYRLLGLMLFWHIAGCATQAPAPRPAKEGIYHVVKAGETLYRIGKAYDLNHAELARVNQLRDPNQIRVGQRLFIPGAARHLPVEIITPADSSVSIRSIPESSDLPDDDNGIVWPVMGGINSHFGRRGASFHDGIDISAQEGTSIRAIGKGEVIYSDQLRGYGNLVILRHSGGLVSVYAHNQVNLVNQGQFVAQGDIIAKVGSTGRVTGPHLHLEIRKNNVAQDPLLYLPQLCCRQSSDIVAPKLITE